MKWVTKRTNLNDQEVFKYSSIRLIVISTVKLSKESLNKIHDIVKEEKGSYKVCSRIHYEISESKMGSLFLEKYGKLKRYYIEIDTKRVEYMDWRV